MQNACGLKAFRLSSGHLLYNMLRTFMIISLSIQKACLRSNVALEIDYWILCVISKRPRTKVSFFIRTHLMVLNALWMQVLHLNGVLMKNIMPQISCLELDTFCTMPLVQFTGAAKCKLRSHDVLLKLNMHYLRPCEKQFHLLYIDVMLNCRFVGIAGRAMSTEWMIKGIQ